MLKIIVGLLFLAMIISLGSALFSLLTQKDQGARTVKMLTLRIVLSIIAFVLLILGYATGLIQPHGLL